MSEDRPDRATDCAIDFEGTAIPAVAGEPIAVSLFAAGTKVLSRSIKYHRPRGFFCLAGHCGACLMRIDGQPNVKACRAPARDGVAVERRNAFPSGSLDVLSAADFFFPKGMDHHTMFTAPRALNSLMQKVVRQLGGLGRLPDPATIRASGPGERLVCDVAIVGGGPAGLRAAIACAAPGRRVVVFDEGDRPGGSLLTHPQHGSAAADALVERARRRGVEIRPRAAAIAFYPEDDGGLLAVDDAGDDTHHLVRVFARRTVYATGGYDVNLPFRDNDRPGVLAARAVGALLCRYGIVPGRRTVVLGNGPYAQALAAALGATGCEVTLVDGQRERVVAASGTRWVSGVEIAATGDGTTRRVKCDLVAVAARPAPASELPRQHGAEVRLSVAAGGFAVVVDARGETGRDGVFAAGDVCGYRGPDEAGAHGEAVGRAVAEAL